MRLEKGKIITITSSKGGAGKSIFVLNLAGIYQRLEKKVLLLDLDLSGGSLAVSLNVPVKKTIYNAIDDLMHNRYGENEDYISSYSQFIDVVSCPKDPRQAMKLENRYLDVFLERVASLYDVVLVDTAHGFSKTNIMAFDQSNRIVYLLTNDLLDLKNSKNFMSIMRDVEMDSLTVILNHSLVPHENYFSNFDIRTMIHWGIDYVLPPNLYIRNLNQYLLEGVIPTLDSKTWDKKYRSYAKKLFQMAEDFIKGEDLNGEKDIHGGV